MKKDSTSTQVPLGQSLSQTFCEVYDTLFPADCRLSKRKRQYRCYLFSFGVPFILMMMVYCSIGAWPFVGPNSPLVLDMNGQYVYFFANLRSIILEDNSLLYSWSRSLGGEFLGMYAYYLASPISWIVLLFPEDMITEAIWLMLVLKTGICGLTMSVFLDKVYPTKTLNIVLFSTLYAFCAYNLAYMSNIMWMDGVMLLPLLILGLEQLMTDGKYKLYTLILAVIILSNYYIGFMICIFVVLYMIHYHIAHVKNSISENSADRYYCLKSIVRVGAYSILSAVMSAVIILPAYYSLQFGKTDYGHITYSHFEIQNLTDLISKLFFGHFDTINPDGSPFVYCGVLTLLTLPLFFLSKQISVREKLGSAFLLMVLVVSMVIPEVDILWHGGQTPNWMNFRYSFLFSFVLIVSAYRGFASIRQINIRYLPVIGGVLMVCSVFISCLDYSKRYAYVQTFDWDYNRFILVANLLIVSVLMVILWKYKTSMINPENHEADSELTMKRGPVIGLAACVLLEAYTAGVLQNTTLAMDVGYASRDSYVDFIHTTQPAVDYVYQKDECFYRMEKTFFRMGNDNMALDIRGVSGSTSTMNSNTLDLLKHLGYSSSSYISWYYGGNPVNDSLIGIKYIISDSSGIEKQHLSDFYDLVYEDEANDRYVFENPYVLSIAFVASEDITKIGDSIYRTPFEMLNAVLNTADGHGTEIFQALEVSTSDIIREEHTHSECENEEHDHDEISECGAHYIRSYICHGTDEPVYLYLPVYSRNDLHIFLNGEAVELNVPLDCSAGIISLGKFDTGTKYEIVMYSGSPELLIDGRNILYALDMAEFRSTIAVIQKNQLEIVPNSSEVRIAGTVTTTEEKPILFTTIPYDKNWIVYVDGERIESKLTLDSLLAVELPSGDHEIVFQYQSMELIFGSVISLLGLTVFVSIVFGERRKKRSYED
ncbi:MAG: YfhO family protein [Clostridia bacterium]|nr:YfhO family protein [Clostridia bacterium]